MTGNPFESQETVRRFARNVDIAIRTDTYTRGKLFVDLAKRNIPEGGFILDYGCGPGRISLMVAQAGYKVRGIDPSPEMISEANSLDREGLTLDFELGGQLALERAGYDGILCSSVIDYVGDPDALLQAFHRSLRPGSTLVVSHGNTYSPFLLYWSHSSKVYNPFLNAVQRHWTPSAFRDLLVRNGFELTSRPRYFDPTYERWFGSLLLRVPFVGSLSIVAARRR